MRPAGIRLDRMSAEEVIAPDSPYWEVRRKYLDLGINMETLGSLSPEDFSVLFPVIFEELGYGDAGLAISLGAAILPMYLAAKFNNQFLLERFPDTMIGCWGITEPDHGSDSLDPNKQILDARGQYGRPNCVATMRGDTDHHQRAEVGVGLERPDRRGLHPLLRRRHRQRSGSRTTAASSCCRWMRRA